MTKICKNCGSELEDSAVFCDECGTKVGVTSHHTGSYASSNNPFRIYKIDMIQGEKVIRSSQIHIGCLYLPLAVILFAFIFGLMFGMLTGGAGFLIMLPVVFAGLVWAIIRYIGYKSNDLMLTYKRILGKCGLISTTQMQVPINRIDSVSYSNGLFGKLIGYGTVEIATASSHFKFRFIREGQTFYNDIFHQLEKSEKEKRHEDAKAIADAISN